MPQKPEWTQPNLQDAVLTLLRNVQEDSTNASRAVIEDPARARAALEELIQVPADWDRRVFTFGVYETNDDETVRALLPVRPVIRTCASLEEINAGFPAVALENLSAELAHNAFLRCTRPGTLLPEDPQ